MKSLYIGNENSNVAKFLELALSRLSRKKEQLELIGQKGNHFEKWFQLELAVSFLKNKSPKVFLEDVKSLDQTKKGPAKCCKNYNCQIDITYRRPNELADRYSGLELKEGSSLADIKRSAEDLLKIKAITGSQWDFRDFSFVFIYPVSAEPSRRREEFQEFMEHLQGRPDFFRWQLTAGKSKWEVLALIWETSLPIKSRNIDLSKDFFDWASKVQAWVNYVFSVPPETKRLRDGKN